MMRKIILIYFLSTIVLKSVAQDPTFSQFFQKNPYVNPAYTGIYGGKEIHTITHHREQWMQVPIRFSSSLVSIDWRICQKNLGVGLMALQNIQGEGKFTSTDFSIPIAAHIPINDEISISSAIQTTLATRKINWENLIFSDELDPILGEVYTSSATKPNESYFRIYPSAGFIITKKFKQQRLKHDYINLGIAGHHLPIGRNSESFYGMYENSKYPTKLTIHANWFSKINGIGSFSTYKGGRFIGEFFDYTNIYYKLENQGSLKSQNESFTSMSFGAGVSMKKLVMFGIGYRQGFRKTKDQDGENFERSLMAESIIFNTVLNINPKNIPYKIYLTYSFDMNISDLGYRFSGPTHEISLNMYIGNITCRNKKRKGIGHWLSGGKEICDPFPKISDWDGY